MFDIIIKNGIVVDGTGSKGIISDVGISKNKITAIGKIGDNAKAAKTINATDKFVCPGFVDILDHSDSFWTLFSTPRLDSKVMQGVTTIIGGNCGSSLAPIIGENSIESIRKWIDIGGININWSRVREFLSVLGDREIGINFGTLVGHETLRRGLMGDEVRKITDEEVKIMGKMLEDSLREGAFGMSTGLIFSHAKMTTITEIKYLAEILESNKSLYASHIRGEAEELLPSINETIQICRMTRASVEISHLKAVGEKYWPDMSRAIRMIDVVNEEGLNIDFDIYPYDTTGSVLYIILPDWVTEGGRKNMLQKLRNMDLRKKIIQEMQEMDYKYKNITISICPKLKEITGKNIVEIADRREICPEEAIIELLISANGHVIVFDREILSEKNIESALQNEHCIVASGDAAYNVEYVRTGEIVHPRCFGTFSRVLGRYALGEKILSVEKAIEKMTSKPAKKIGIKDRGILKKGFYADVVVFDPKDVMDRADYSNPYQYSTGIDYVFVNGKIVVQEGEHTGELAGKVLKK